MWFVELIKAIAWPIAAIVIAVGYKPEILGAFSAFLRRKLEFEAFGFKARIDVAEQQQTTAESPVSEKLPQVQMLGPHPSAAVNRMEIILRDQALAIDVGSREPTLLRALAISRILAGHEFVYNRIFGSQIAWLKRLNELGHATVDQAQEFFKPFGEQFPQTYSSYGFDGWLGFLRTNALVEQEGTTLQISDFGRDFLIYLTERRLLEAKPW